MRRELALAAGGVVIAFLLVLLPAPVFAVTQTILYLTAALVLVLVALALFLAPARRLLSDAFTLGLRVPEGALLSGVREDEQRAVLRPLVTAAVCAGVAALAGLLR